MATFDLLQDGTAVGWVAANGGSGHDSLKVASSECQSDGISHKPLRDQWYSDEFEG